MTLLERIHDLEEKRSRATPGPYRTEGGMDHYVFDAFLHTMIAEVRGVGAGLSDEQMANNAHFIVAAANGVGEICEALKSYHAKLSILRRFHGGDGSVTHEQVIEALGLEEWEKG